MRKFAFRFDGAAEIAALFVFRFFLRPIFTSAYASNRIGYHLRIIPIKSTRVKKV